MLHICNMDYHKDTERISKSGLDLINKSPLHYWEKYLNPMHKEKTTHALTFGSAVHTAVLEPAEFGKRYSIIPDIDRRTKEGKLRYAEYLETVGDKEMITREDSNNIEHIMTAVNRHPQASLLKSKITEVEQIYTHEDMKCRPDAITSLGIVLDLKTTEDASPKAFGRSATKYRYDVQAAFYTDILKANGVDVNGFVFIAVEKTPPYAVACYVIEDADLNIGREKYLENLAVWRQCRDKNEWKGYQGLNKLEIWNK